MKSPNNIIVSSELEDLLESFNSNPNNAKVIDYVSRSNLFDIIGKSRHEMVHSRMIAELLAGKFFRISNKMTLIHFLDIVVHRAKQQGKSLYLGEELKKAILTRSLQVDSVDQCRMELTLKSYTDFANNHSSFDNITPRQALPGEKKRLDIFLRYSLANTQKIKGNFRQNLEIFIENKVLATESDNQTRDYYSKCKKKTCHKLFIYLTPLSLRELNDYNNLKIDLKPESNAYIHLSYQDIVDRILEPLLAEPGLNTRDRVLLNEYINCLELPALPDDSDKQYSKKELSIMATSQVERNLIRDFISDPENARLLEIAVNRKLDKDFYAFGEKKYLTFDQALKIALLNYTNHHSELDTLNSFKDVITKKGGGACFLLYVVKITDDKLYYIPTDLYEYNKNAYSNISEALKVAVKDFINRKQVTPDRVVEEFRQDIKGRGRKPPMLFISQPSSAQDYSEVLNGLYILNKINSQYLDEINCVLGSGYSITRVSPKCYHDLLLEGNDSLWKHYEKKNNLYTRLLDTHYYYRSEINEDKLDDINSILSNPTIRPFAIENKDTDLLDRFFKNNRSLILSVYKILLETETDRIIYSRNSKDYHRLIKP